MSDFKYESTGKTESEQGSFSDTLGKTIFMAAVFMLVWICTVLISTFPRLTLFIALTAFAIAVVFRLDLLGLSVILFGAVGFFTMLYTFFTPNNGHCSRKMALFLMPVYFVIGTPVLGLFNHSIGDSKYYHYVMSKLQTIEIARDIASEGKQGRTQ